MSASDKYSIYDIGWFVKSSVSDSKLVTGVTTSRKFVWQNGFTSINIFSVVNFLYRLRSSKKSKFDP
jgi:hypothetical protein